MTEPLVLTAEGVPVPLEDGGFVLEEARDYELRLPGRSRATPLLGGLPLDPLGDGAFTLRLGHAVGDLVLTADDDAWPVRVLPRADKLSPELWAAMLGELEAWWGGASVGLAGARHGAVDRTGVSLPLLVEALAPLLPALEAALRRLLQQPRERATTRLDEDLPLRMARRVDRETLAWVGRHPDVARWLRPWDAIELTGPEPVLPQRRAHDTPDHPANRYVAWLVHRVVARLDATVAALRRLATRPDDDTSAWCAVRADGLRRGARRLDDLWRRSFLARLPREPATEAALLVVLDDPVYARVHRLGRRFLSPLFRLDDGPEPQAAVRPSFTLYELWCLLAVGRQLETLLPVADGWSWRWEGRDALLRPTSHGTGAQLVGEHPREGRCTLEFNPVFTGFLARRGTRWSLSRQRRPDLVVRHDPREGRGAWLVLDAKYRAGVTNLADAFTSVHVYRDALRDDERGGPCRAACLLTPSTTPGSEAWYADDFRAEHGCGIWELRPGVPTNPDLGRWILDTLAIGSDGPRGDS